MKLHPGLTVFIVNLCIITCRRIGQDDDQNILIAINYLYSKFFAVGCPEWPGNVLVNVIICFDPCGFGGCNICYPHLHLWVWISRFRIWSSFNKSMNSIRFIQPVQCKNRNISLISSKICYFIPVRRPPECSIMA